jgi:hypothetical protein
MSRHHTANHPRRALPRPIVDAEGALELISLAMHDPMQPEVIAFLLDDQGVGGTIVIVSDAVDVDAVVRVAETMALAAVQTDLRRLVMATIRPWSATLPGDADRWLEASATTQLHDVELIEWFVVGPSGPECPRQLLGEADRW